MTLTRNGYAIGLNETWNDECKVISRWTDEWEDESIGRDKQT